MSNVQAIPPTDPMPDEQRWRCQVCGKEMAYSQPISLGLSALLVGTFGDYHDTHCVVPETKEVTE